MITKVTIQTNKPTDQQILDNRMGVFKTARVTILGYEVDMPEPEMVYDVGFISDPLYDDKYVNNRGVDIATMCFEAWEDSLGSATSYYENTKVIFEFSNPIIDLSTLFTWDTGACITDVVLNMEGGGTQTLQNPQINEPTFDPVTSIEINVRGSRVRTGDYIATPNYVPIILEEIDITDGFVIKAFNKQKRIDEAFATGKAKLRSATINYNIPPYTLMRVSYDNKDSDLFYCSSTATHYLTENVWIHDIDLLELTAILECMILGSKCFSVTGENKADWAKIRIITELMIEKYGWNISYDRSIYQTMNREDLEFPFGAGTTVYQALTEISKRYNKRPKIIDVSHTTLYLTFEDITKGAEYKLKDNRILNVEYVQNVNDYCKYLETEATNVVDRNRPITCNGLTIRGESVATNADNCTLYLPTRVEEVLSLDGIGENQAKCNMQFSLNIALKDIMGLTDQNPVDGTWSNWVDKTGGETSFLHKVYKKFLWRCDINALQNLIFTAVLNPSYNRIEFYPTYPLENGKFIMPYKCLSEGEWMLLSPTEQPKYCYYKSGESEIFNTNSIIKDSLWEQILGQTSGPFTRYPDYDTASIKFTATNPADDVLYAEVRYLSGSIYPFATDLMFNVKYIPMTNPFIFNKKTIDPVNESEFKPIARSYNNSSEFIDHDLLSTNIQKTNNMLGTIECSIEYDLLNESEPKPSQIIRINGYDYYIISTETRFNLNKRIVLINLARTYYKDAEAIGVPTQFNKLKNPYKGIIDRPIYKYFKNDKAPIKFKIDNAFIKFTFYNEFNDVINTLYKRATFTQTEEGQVRVYCEMQDEYAFDKQSVKRTSGFEIKDIAYVDRNNECYSVGVEIGNINANLTMEQSRNLPFYNGVFESAYEFKPFKIYKDAREHLTFTFEFDGAIILE